MSAAAQKLEYFAFLIVGALLLVAMWLLIRRCCYECGMGTAGRDVPLTPDDIADQELESESERSEVRNRSNSGWFRNWTSKPYHSPESTQRLVKKMFRDGDDGASKWNEIDEEADTSSELVAVPARMTKTLGCAELKKGYFSGDSESQFENVYVMSKLQLPQIDSSPESPRFLNTEILRPKPHSSAAKDGKQAAGKMRFSPTHQRYLNHLSSPRSGQIATTMSTLSTDSTVITTPQLRHGHGYGHGYSAVVTANSSGVMAPFSIEGDIEDEGHTPPATRVTAADATSPTAAAASGAVLPPKADQDVYQEGLRMAMEEPGEKLHNSQYARLNQQDDDRVGKIG